MDQEDVGYHAWTEEELVRETVSNLESLEGIDRVEWVSLSPYATFQELIRIWTHGGHVVRLAIGYSDDEELQEVFDQSFPDE